MATKWRLKDTFAAYTAWAALPESRRGVYLEVEYDTGDGMSSVTSAGLVAASNMVYTPSADGSSHKLEFTLAAAGGSFAAAVESVRPNGTARGVYICDTDAANADYSWGAGCTTLYSFTGTVPDDRAILNVTLEQRERTDDYLSSAPCSTTTTLPSAPASIFTDADTSPRMAFVDDGFLQAAMAGEFDLQSTDGAATYEAANCATAGAFRRLLYRSPNALNGLSGTQVQGAVPSTVSDLAATSPYLTMYLDSIGTYTMWRTEDGTGTQAGLLAECVAHNANFVAGGSPVYLYGFACVTQAYYGGAWHTIAAGEPSLLFFPTSTGHDYVGITDGSYVALIPPGSNVPDPAWYTTLVDTSAYVEAIGGGAIRFSAAHVGSSKKVTDDSVVGLQLASGTSIGYKLAKDSSYVGIAFTTTGTGTLRSGSRAGSVMYFKNKTAKPSRTVLTSCTDDSYPFAELAPIDSMTESCAVGDALYSRSENNGALAMPVSPGVVTHVTSSISSADAKVRQAMLVGAGVGVVQELPYGTSRARFGRGAASASATIVMRFLGRLDRLDADITQTTRR